MKTQLLLATLLLGCGGEQTAAPPTDAGVDTFVSGPVDLRVRVDEARAALMLKNLVSNALRYTPADHGTVDIDFESRDGHWQIIVSDQGPGIAPDQAAQIGEPFFRGDPSRTRDTGGSGLGLYLARLVANAHGGSLELLTDRAPGACFRIILPTGGEQ